MAGIIMLRVVPLSTLAYDGLHPLCVELITYVLMPSKAIGSCGVKRLLLQLLHLW